MRPTRELVSDTAWSYLAFAGLATGGALLNGGIGALAGADALGVFNQLLAAYAVAAQLAVFGLHDAVQKYVASEPGARAAITASGTRWVLGTGALVALAMSLLAGPLGRAFDSPEVGAGLRWVAAALVPFTLNKVWMGSLVGQRRMRPWAFAQLLRIGTLTTAAFAVIAAGRPPGDLGAAFLAAECAVAPALFAWVRPRPTPDAGRWHAALAAFAARALPNSALADNALKLSVLALATTATDAEVGVYAFATLFAEGLVQVGVTVRAAAASRLVVALAEPGRPSVPWLARRVMALGLGSNLAAAAGVFAVYPALGWVFAPELVAGARPALGILALGLAVYAAFLPLDFALLQAGQPGRQSAWMSVNVATNLALNLWLAPRYGVAGAALGTALG
ncbi:MAG: hypothetical protein ABMA64_30240, partial [Myxococcota bacterium]